MQEASTMMADFYKDHLLHIIEDGFILCLAIFICLIDASLDITLSVSIYYKIYTGVSFVKVF